MDLEHRPARDAMRSLVELLSASDTRKSSVSVSSRHFWLCQHAGGGRYLAPGDTFSSFGPGSIEQTPRPSTAHLPPLSTSTDESGRGPRSAQEVHHLCHA